MTTLRLATRRSKLALAQARAYVRYLKSVNDQLEVEELHVVTSGDKFQDRSLIDIGGKGLFIKEIEEALLEQQAEFAVHSIKDVPADLAASLHIASVPEREDPRDVIVTRDGGPLASLAPNARVGTSSLRRRTMLLRARPDLDIRPLRGNVDTRLRKLEAGEVDAIILAYAGLKRLDMADRASEVLEPEVSLPAVGQGALGIECLETDEQTTEILAKTDHAETRIRVSAERAFMRAVEGNCHLPVAAYCVREGDILWLRGMFADAEGNKVRFGERREAWTTDHTEAERLGRDLGQELKGS